MGYGVAGVPVELLVLHRRVLSQVGWPIRSVLNHCLQCALFEKCKCKSQTYEEVKLTTVVERNLTKNGQDLKKIGIQVEH